jgi:hypothetical protein
MLYLALLLVQRNLVLPKYRKGPCQLLAVQQSEDGSPPFNVAKSNGTVHYISFCSSNKRKTQKNIPDAI